MQAFADEIFGRHMDKWSAEVPLRYDYPTSPDAHDDCDNVVLKIRMHCCASAQAEPNVTEVSAIASTTSTVPRFVYGPAKLVSFPEAHA